MKKILKTGAIVLTVIVVLLSALLITANIFLNKIQRADDFSTIPAEEEFFETDENVKGEELNPEEVTWEEQQGLGDESLINILLVGQDRRPGQGRQRSDTMILCSFNPETNALSMISFLRDLYVQIPGYSDNRLNAAYVFGGFPLLKQSLYVNFGVTVDGCAEVDFDGFREIIDTVGGVDIELTADEAKIVGGSATAGLCHLDGEQALTYARIRYLDSDFGRTNRQRKVILSVIEKMRGKSPSDLLAIVNAVLPLITTDMSNSQIMQYSLKYAPALKGLKVSTHYVPASGCYRNAMIRGMAVLVPDLAKIRTALKEEYLPLS
ncbi:MAG: LCP family protein [Oscillospiraceae bacterium]|nr:LCP family protein [Oscillospiraceae bacterium]